MKQKFFLLALLCVGCTLVGYGQRKPSNQVTTRPAQQTTAQRPNSRTTASASSKNNALERLPEFEKSGGKPFMDVLRDRETFPSLQREVLQPEQLSQLMWVACGTTTPENYTAFKVTQMPCVDMYYIGENGIYRYERDFHELSSIRRGNYTNLLMGNDDFSVDAAAAIFFVFKPGDFMSDSHRPVSEIEAAINCGAIMQNIALYCSSEDLSCLPVNFSDAHKAELLKAINQGDAMVLYGIVIGKR
ncbi:MAG: nitroreductase family protein [Bacteroidales bacterium]|nr:nitroreductase family protein [Bacteroidales bacterium]